MQTINHFYTFRCQAVGFFPILGNKVISFEIFQMKIYLGMIADPKMPGDIHKTHLSL